MAPSKKKRLSWVSAGRGRLGRGADPEADGAEADADADADGAGASKAADEDHVALVQAFWDRDPTRAAHVMARHAARVVLVAQATLAPERDPQLARSALAFALGAEAPFSMLTAAQ